MRSARFGVLLFLWLFSIPMWAQQLSAPQYTAQTPEQAAQAAALIQQSLTAQIGGTQISDITLSGSVTISQGANKGSGTIVYAASVGGKTRGTLTMPSGTQTMFRDYSVSPRIGRSIGPDGTSKAANQQDLMGPHPDSYFPALIMTSVLSASGYASADMGQETQNGVMVRHVAIWPKYGPTVMAPSAALQQLGQEDLYLDPASLLPVALTFNLIATNPDETYIGSTSDLRKRLSEHNSGKSIHTNKFKPWHLTAYIALPGKNLAEKFERYLKSGSGRAFAKKRLLMQNRQIP